MKETQPMSMARWFRWTRDTASSLTHGCTSWAYDLTVLATLCTSLTWILQRFCGAPEDIWQSLWTRFIDYFHRDEFTLIVGGTQVLTIGLYWGLGSIYMLMDVTGWPKWIRKYKVQPGTHEPIDTQKLAAGLRQVLVNQFLVALPLSLITFPMLKWKGIRPFDVLPPLSEVMRDLVVFLLVVEFMFYYIHRMFHHPWFYKRIHKKHHEWTAPVALMATYCHPLEHFIANLTPMTAGIVLMNSHLATSWLWYSITIIITLSDHSGYHLPFFPSPEFHDFHHLKFNQTYGSLGILDYLHGTDRSYRSSPQYKRHIVSPNLQPVRQIYPDELNRQKVK